MTLAVAAFLIASSVLLDVQAISDRSYVYRARTAGEVWSPPLFSRDGSFAIFASLDRTIRRVELPSSSHPNVSVAWMIMEVGPVRGGLRFSHDEKHFFSVTLFGNIFCRDVTNGEVRWSSNTSVPAWVFTPTLVLEQNWLLVGNREGELLVLDASNGRRVHVLKEGAGIWAEPIVFPFAASSQSSDDRMIAYGVTAGAIVKAASFSSSAAERPVHARWTYDLVPGATHWKQRTRSWIFGAPAVTQSGTAHPRVVFGSGNHHLYSVSAMDGKLVWSIGVPGGVSSQPVVVRSTSTGEEHIIVVTEHGWVVCVDDRAGQPRWNRSLGQSVGASVSLAVVDRAHLVVIGTIGGRLFGLRTEDGTEMFREEVSGCEVKAKLATHFSPKSQSLLVGVGCKQGGIGVITVDGILDVEGDPAPPINISEDQAAQDRSLTPEADGPSSLHRQTVAVGATEHIESDAMSLSYPFAVAACGGSVMAALTLWWRRHSSRTSTCPKRL